MPLEFLLACTPLTERLLWEGLSIYIHLFTFLMARRIGTSRMAVHSLLDQAKPTMTIDSVSRAAATLGADLEMKVVSRQAPSHRPAKPKRKAA